MDIALTYFHYICLAIMIALCIVFRKMWNKRSLYNIKTFTPSELSQFDGVKTPLVYVAVNNTVFDVTKSNNYGPKCTYSLFAGHDITVSLGKMSFEIEFLDCAYGMLNSEERYTMEQWYNKFESSYKYPIVGRMQTESAKSKAFD